MTAARRCVTSAHQQACEISPVQQRAQCREGSKQASRAAASVGPLSRCLLKTGFMLKGQPPAHLGWMRPASQRLTTSSQPPTCNRVDGMQVGGLPCD